MRIILGLDPAKPAFEDWDAIVRLDVTDATYVDVIHTDIKCEYMHLITSTSVFAFLKLCNKVRNWRLSDSNAVWPNTKVNVASMAKNSVNMLIS